MSPYSHRKVTEGLYLIEELYYRSGNRANIWLVQGGPGADSDILVDSGLGIYNLRQYLADSGLVAAGREVYIKYLTIFDGISKIP